MWPLIIYAGLAFYTIRCTVKKEWEWYVLLASIGLVMIYYRSMTKAIYNIGASFPLLYTYVPLVLLAFVLWIVATAPHRRMKRNPVFVKTQELYKSLNGASAVYVCVDGVAICSGINKNVAREMLYESPCSITRYIDWMFEVAPVMFSVDKIPDSIVMKRVHYAEFGFENMFEEIALFTRLLAKSLNLNKHLFKKEFYTPPSVSSGAPTGAITVNGVTTFTGGTTTEKEQTEIVCYMGEVSVEKVKVEKKKVELKKSW